MGKNCVGHTWMPVLLIHTSPEVEDSIKSDFCWVMFTGNTLGNVSRPTGKEQLKMFGSKQAPVGL